FIIYEVVIFINIKKLFITVKFNIMSTFTLINFFEMIYLYQSILWHLSSDFVMQTKDICVFRNRNTDVILFYICRHETCTSYLKYYHKNKLFACCILLSVFLYILLSLSEKCHAFTLMSEAILIKDNYTAETTLFYSQASSVTFSLFSAEKVVYKSGY
ncbi:hypothetical protein BDBG_16789, partial [Blastomyces gilchristii SLH14081]